MPGAGRQGWRVAGMASGGLWRRRLAEMAHPVCGRIACPVRACHCTLAQAPQLRLVDIRGLVRGGHFSPALALSLVRGTPGTSGQTAFRVVCRLQEYELVGARRVLEAAGKVRRPGGTPGTVLPGCEGSITREGVSWPANCGTAT